jgi:hypothetical protein
MMSRNLFD